MCYCSQVTAQHRAAGKTINRKRFLGEHERTVNSFACRPGFEDQQTVYSNYRNVCVSRCRWGIV
ncbi:MAG: hypothetical protein FWC60_08270 [Firmicutes bacterium]|nr:hypothetical protein [Bacillota bacterium]